MPRPPIKECAESVRNKSAIKVLGGSIPSLLKKNKFIKGLSIMEKNVVVQRKDEKPFVNVPANLEGIEYGDYLVIANYPDTHKYTKEQMWIKDFRIIADDYIRYMLEEKQETGCLALSKNIPDTHMRILRENGCDVDFDQTDYVEVEFYVDQLAFFDKKPGEKKAEVKKAKYSIHHAKQDKAILEEMIAKVDRDRFVKICGVSLGRGRKPNPEVVDKYLEEWAKAKYDWYVAFGNNLVVSKDVEYKMSEAEVMPMLTELYEEFPMYAANLVKIEENGGPKAFIENKMPEVDFFSKYCPKLYKPGMKVSGFLHNLYHHGEGRNDIADKFDLRLSELMQNRMIKGKICISIDPYDFLTSATNMHGWTTCQKLWGDMAGGCYTWLTDPNALIAYRCNGKDYLYDHGIAKGINGMENFNFGANKFSGNSKTWRQIINCDRNNCAFLFGREYPSNTKVEFATETARQLLEDTIGKYLGITDWANYGDLERIDSETYFGAKPIYKDVTNHHYSDIGNWNDLRHRYQLKKALIAPMDGDLSTAQITAGGKTYCLRCGREIGNNNHRVTCGGCE